MDSRTLEGVLQREELYDLVWTEPVRRVAARLGISDVALAKACRGLDVPLPERGYWAKVRAGHQTARPPLPPAGAGAKTEYRVRPPRERTLMATAPPSIPAVPAEIPNVIVKVPASLRDAHPLVLRAASEIKKRKSTPYKGMVQTTAPFDIHVSVANIDRALRILDALVKALQEAGCAIVPWTDYEHRAYVLVDKEKIQFRITEGMRRHRHERSELESKRSGFAPMYEFRSSGELRFKVTRDDSYGAEDSWADCKKGKLEEFVQFIFGAFFHISADRKRLRVERERVAKSMAERLQRKLENDQQIARERAKTDGLQKMSAEWHEARLLRDFIDAVEAKEHAQSVDTIFGIPFEEWLRWAHGVADAMDPLGQSSPSSMQGVVSERGKGED